MSAQDNATKLGKPNQNLVLETAGRIYVKVQDRFYELDFRNQNNKSVVNVTNNITEAADSPDLSGFVTKKYLKASLAEYVTKRTWAGIKETTNMLENALLEGFTESISPITINTMQLVVGSEQLQYDFITDFTTTQAISHGIEELTADHLELNECYIKHYTINGPNAVRKETAENTTEIESQYCRWHIAAGSFDLDDGPYYLYLKVPILGDSSIEGYPVKESFGDNYMYAGENNYSHSATEAIYWKTNAGYPIGSNINSLSIEDGEYVISQSAISFDSENGYYHLLFAIINSASDDGEREFTTMNGFTEITPGRITAYRFISPDGNQYLNFLDKTFHLGDAALSGEIPNPDDPNTPNTNSNGSYIHWDPKNGLMIKGKVQVTGGDLEDVLNLIQNQIDGSINSWFSGDPENNNATYSYDLHCEPTLSTWPANTWTDHYDEHLGDLYYITDDTQAYKDDQSDPKTADTYKGFAYRFVKETDSNNQVQYKWVLLSDDSISEALRIAYENRDKIAGYDYLKAALMKGATSINGGLVLSNLIQLGEWDQILNDDGEVTDTHFSVWSGINGLQEKTQDGIKTHRDIAAWYGGAMWDREDFYRWDDNTHQWILKSGQIDPGNIPKTVFRHDGSGYLANGNIFWESNGSLRVPGITLEGNGRITLDSGVIIDGTNTSIGEYNAFFEIDRTHTDAGNKNPIKLKDTLYSGIRTSGYGVFNGIISTSDVVAYGTADSSTSPTAYNRLDPTTFTQDVKDYIWPTFDSTKNGYVLSAALGWNLNKRITILENSGGGSGGGGSDPTGGETTAITMPSPYFDVSNNPSPATRTLQVSLTTSPDGTNYTLPSLAKMSLFDPNFVEDGGNITTTVDKMLIHFPTDVDGNVIAYGDVVAYGQASQSVSPVIYTRLDPYQYGDAPSDYVWPTYNSEQNLYVLSGALAWNLQNRLTVLERDAGTGSVTSVSLEMPDCFNVGGSPITSSGTLNVTLKSEYTIPTTVQINKIQEFDDIFDVIYDLNSDPAVIEGILAKYPININGGLFASGDVVAYGSASSSISPTAYNRLDPSVVGESAITHVWPTYDSNKLEYILSASLGWNLNARVTALEANPGGGGGGTGGITLAGVWNSLTNYTQDQYASTIINSAHIHIDDATTSASGLMSASDKTKLNGIEAGAQKNTVTSVAGYTGNIPINYIATSLINNGAQLTDTVTYINNLAGAITLSNGTGISITKSGQTITITNTSTGTTYNQGTGINISNNTISLASGVITTTGTYRSVTVDTYGRVTGGSNPTTISGYGITDAKFGTASSDYVPITLGSTTKNVLTSHQSLAAYATTASLGSFAYISSLGFSDLSSHPTTVSGYGITDALTSIPKAESNKYGGIKVGYTTSAQDQNYKVQLDTNGNAFVNVPWVNPSGSYLPLSGGTLTGSLTGTTATFNTATFGTSSTPGSVSIKRNSYTVTISLDTSGNVLITPPSGKSVLVSGTVKASGDVVAYN